MLEKDTLAVLTNALAELDKGFSHLPDFKKTYDLDTIEPVLMEVARRMRDNYPYFHPLYAGQMLKPPHPVARLAYTLALWINPNNHALDGGRASSFLEKEAVAQIARLFGWETFLGHLTGGGTMANLEALWISGKLNPGKTVVASRQAHYTHERISTVLQLPFSAIACTGDGRMDVAALKKVLDREDVGTVVATIGATGTGAVDPLADILALKEKYNFRIHADAAYGGYFFLADNLSADVQKSYQNLSAADSIVVDPHKHGLQPYGCGCVLFRDPGVGTFYKHDSPYTYFSSDDLHLGEISLECSRPGAAAVALWATQKLLPLEPRGAFAADLEKSRQAALRLYRKIESDKRFKTLFPPDLDIVVWAVDGAGASEISSRSEALFKAAARQSLHLATFKYPSTLVGEIWPDVKIDQPDVTLLRSCLMKPEHDQWVDRIWDILVGALASLKGSSE